MKHLITSREIAQMLVDAHRRIQERQAKKENADD